MSIWRTSEIFNGTVWNENKMHSFQKNIEFLWGINYNGDIDSEGSRLWQKLEDHR